MSSIVERLFKNEKENPDKLAIIFNNEGVSYGDFAQLIREFASSLKEKKISKGSRIIIEAGNLVSFFAALLACQLHGAIAIPIENNISVYKLNKLINLTKPKLVFFKDNGENFSDYFEPETIKKFTLPKDDATFCITYTTGTTGDPSLVVHSNRSTFATIENLAMATNIDNNTVMYTNIPCDLAAGYRRVFSALYYNATVIISQKSINIDDLTNICKKYSVNHLSLICSDIISLVTDSSDKYFLDSINTVESVAGELVPSIITSFYKKFTNGVLYNVYGTTESGCLLINDTSKNSVDNCLGTPSVNTTINLIDENGHEITSPGKYGYVSVSGPMNMTGYYKKKDLTEKVLHGGKVILNDIVYFDEAGYYYFVSRVGDILNIQGHKIAPYYIERIANEFQGVRATACTAKIDSRCKQIPILYIELDNKFEFDINKFKKYLKKNMEPYRVPQELYIVEQIPRTASGKIIRKSLAFLNRD